MFRGLGFRVLGLARCRLQVLTTFLNPQTPKQYWGPCDLVLSEGDPDLAYSAHRRLLLLPPNPYTPIG